MLYATLTDICTSFTSKCKACVCAALLTPCIAVKQKRVLELEVQVFGDWLCQVLHTESVHYGETMPWRCQSEMQNTERCKECVYK